MRFGICAAAEAVAALPALPFDYLEEDVQRFLAPESAEDVFEENLRRARKLPVPVEAANNLLPPDMVLVETSDQQVDRRRVERYMRTALRRAEAAGIRVIVFGSGRARACPPGYDRGDAVRQIGEHLARWSEWGRERGVQLALEPLRYAETNVLNTVAEAGELVASVADSGAGLLVDLYHMASNGESAESILPWLAYVRHVHVAEREERTAPGRHGDDFRQYFRALQGRAQGAGRPEDELADGYDCRLSVECVWQDLPREVERAMATLREQWEASREGMEGSIEHE